MIRVSEVSKTFNDENFAVRNVSFELAAGKTLVLLGSSGSGKTTLLKMINRLIEPSSGLIWVRGELHHHISAIDLRRSIGYVFQGIGLFPHMTVEENITLVPKLGKWSTFAKKNLAQELLTLVNLDPETYLPRFPGELSGGQQQRVSVARALVGKPDILLMDEPFGALDSITRRELQDELLSLKEKMKPTIIFVTHDLLEAFRIADYIGIMNNGCLEQLGTKEQVITNPQTFFVKELFSQVDHQLKEYLALLNE